MENIRFTKEEVRQELKGALLQFTRTTSAVFGAEAAYRLLGWSASEARNGGALTDVDLDNFDEVAARERQSLDIDTVQLVRTFDEFYDYGVLGVRRSDIDGMTGGTEHSFAYAFICDVERSHLILEMSGGVHSSFPKCLDTARLAQARTILDGGKRYFYEDSDTPEKLLTFGEVALLGGIEERSVRNAASGKHSALRTATEGGKSHVAPGDALEWLSNRKGFVRSSAHGALAAFELSHRPFSSTWEVAEFLRQRTENQGISLQQYCEAAGTDPADAQANPSSTRVWYPEGNERIEAVSHLLGLETELLKLRLEEASLSERAHQLRQSIEQLRARKQP